MQYTNSFVIIRTKKGNTVGCHTVFTHNYKKLMPNQFDYKGYACKSFEILENVGGQVVIKTYDILKHAKINFKNTIRFSNVT